MTIDPFEIQETAKINEPIDKVWDALVTRNGLKHWLNARLFVLQIDDNGRIEIPFLRGDTAVTIVGDTSFINPPHQLIFTWIELDELGREWLFPTSVSLEFVGHNEDTRITLTHKGLKRLPAEIRDEILAQYQDFWREKMGELPTTKLIN